MVGEYRLNAFLCDGQLRSTITARLAEFETHTSERAGKRSSVALAVTDAACGPEIFGLENHAEWSSAAALIMTRRATGLRSHAGQWACPGGRMDAGETAEETALREMHEEINLELDTSDVIGRLDDFVTRSGYVITPVVIWAGPRKELTPNPHEVASIHRIPLEELMREDAPLLTQIPESKNPVLRMPIGDAWIAAPSAALLYQFGEVCLRGTHTRVAHFEQPYFAWR